MLFNNKTYLQLFLGLPCALLLIGCATPPKSKVARSLSAMRIEREKNMELQWSGQPYSSLIAVLGEPEVVLNVPGRSDQSTARVYGILDEHSQCIDAFTVVTFSGHLMVSNYFCR